MSTSDLIARQAQAWHVRLKDPSATDLDRRDFEAWRGESIAHATAYDESVRLWHMLAGPAQALRADRLQRVPASRFRARHFALALATAVLFFVVLMWHDPGLIDRWRADYANPPGSAKTVSLDDGSTVVLDGDAAIRVALSAESRTIQLIRGRAWLDVTPDASRPFVVETPAGSVRVLGTAFSVSRDAGDVLVTVESGRVSVAPLESRESVTLLPGEQARLRRGTIPAVAHVRLDTATAWRRGWLAFDQDSLEAVTEAVQKQGGGRIVLMRPGLAKRRLSGIFRSDDPEAVLGAVEAALDLRVVRIPGVATLIF